MLSLFKRCGLFPVVLGLLTGFGFLLNGCNTLSGQPAMRRAEITPEQLFPGTEGVLTVELRDRQEIVKRVEGVILEDPRLTFRLRNDGQPPDRKAGDGAWSMAVVVPRQAVPGSYTMQITAIAEDGRPIMVRDKHGTVQLMQITLPVVIQPAPAGAESAQPPAQAAPAGQ